MAVRGVVLCAASLLLGSIFLVSAALGVEAPPGPGGGGPIVITDGDVGITIIGGGGVQIQAKPPAAVPGAGKAADKPAADTDKEKKAEAKPAAPGTVAPAAGKAPAGGAAGEPAKEAGKEPAKATGEPSGEKSDKASDNASDKDKEKADAEAKAKADEQAKLEAARKEEQAERDRFFRGADVESDFEADRFLRRARDFATADPPEIRKAILLLQHVIENYADVLTTIDERTYRSLRDTAERMILEMGPDALRTYRTEVDGQVLALVGENAATGDETALKTVERRYFLSTLGDEAAFRLGCLYLDHHQYARARRLLARLLKVYPDLTVPRPAILLRLAVACDRSEDPDGARSALEELDRLGPGGLSADAVAAVRGDLARPGSRAEPVQAARRSCDVARVADLAADGDEKPAGLWVSMWDKPLDLLPPSVPTRYLGIGSKASGPEVEETLRGQIQQRWEQTEWVPAGSVLIDGPDVLVKSAGQLLCLDADTGQVRWATPKPPDVENRSIRFSFSRHRVGPDQPQTPAEFLVFGDRIGKAVGLVGDRVYHIEDHVADQWTHPRTHVVVRIVNGKVIRQGGEETAKGNRLAAYDRRTGKAVWFRGRTLDKDDPLRAVTFLTLPVVCSGRLLVPIEDEEGGLWLAALSPKDGDLLWRVFLCTRISSRQDVWDEIGLAADASEVYVATGEGLVFALDGIDGAIHWASRYERTILDNLARFGGGVATAGWYGNHVFLDGGRLIVLPADAQAVLVFDPPSGSLVTRYDTPKETRCLEVADGRLWAAGPRAVRCLDLQSGRTVWSASFEKNSVGYGQGFVTRQAVYVPVQRSLVGFDRETGKRLTKIAVQTPDDVPLGNVVSDGRRFFVLGAGQVYGLADGKAYLAELDRTVTTVAKDLEPALEQLKETERELEAERKRGAGLARPIMDADHLLAALRSKQETLLDQVASLDREIADLQKQRAEVAAEGGAPPGDPATAAARLRALDAEIAEKTARRADLAAEQEPLPQRIDQAQKGLEQLRTRQAASNDRVEQLKGQKASREGKVGNIRKRLMHACFARGRIETGFDRHDQAVRTYQVAFGAAGDSTWRDEARLALVKAYVVKAQAAVPEVALADLAEAGKVARAPRETLLVRQATAVAYERADQPERALEMYLAALKGGGDALVDVGDDVESWTVSPMSVAANGLKTLVAAYPDRLAGKVQPLARQMLEQARQKGDAKALRAVFRTFQGTAESMAAGMEAAEAAAKSESFEAAELFLHDMLRSENRAAQAAGLACLARLHHGLGWTAQARGEWRRLAEEYADVTIPFDGERVVAGDLARGRLADPAVAEAEGPALTLPPPPWELLWKTEGNTARPYVLDPDELSDFGRPNASQFLLQHVILWMFGNPQRLQCRRLRDGQVVYENQGVNQALVLGRHDSREGHVAISQRGNELTAVGLVTGEVLWSEAASKKIAATSATRAILMRQMQIMMMQGNVQLAAMLYGGLNVGRLPTGTLIGRPDPQSVRVADLATGDVLWERSFRRQTVSGVQEAGRYIGLVMDGGKELIVCDTLTGAVVNRVQVESTIPNSGLVLAGDGFLEVIHDPQANTFVLRRRDLAAGKVLWATEPAQSLPQIRVLDRGNLCLLQRGSDPFEVRDLDTGKVLLRCDVEKDRPTNISDVALGAKDRLLYITSRSGGNNLDIFDLKTGQRAGHYTFGDGPYHRYLPAALYASCGEYLPWAERDPPERINNGKALRYNNLYTVRFVRRSDGKPAEGVTLKSPSREDGKFEHLSSILCQDGVLLVITSRGVEAYGKAPPKPKVIPAE